VKRHLPSALDDSQAVLRKAAIKLLDQDSRDPLQVDTLLRLIEGPRSAAELVEEIYGMTKSHPGYMTSYTRTRRALAKLSTQGLVSRRVFGSTKPYYLTRYARDGLASHATGSDPPKILPRTDRILHISTTTIAILLVLALSGRIQLNQPIMSVIHFVFFFSLGLTTARIIEGVRRVS
jgi:hypothetical protein